MSLCYPNAVGRPKSKPPIRPSRTPEQTKAFIEHFDEFLPAEAPAAPAPVELADQVEMPQTIEPGIENRKEHPQAIAKRDQYIDELNSEFLERLDLAELKTALALSDNSKARQLMLYLLDPRYRRNSIAYLVRKAGMDALQVMDVWRGAAHTRGLLEIWKGLPAVAKDVVLDARSYMDCCNRCDGFGQIYTEINSTNEQKEPIVQTLSKECPKCAGTGQVRKPGNSDARKLIFDTVGWSGKAGPVAPQKAEGNVLSVIEEMEQALSAAKAGARQLLQEVQDAEFEDLKADGPTN